VNDTAHRMSPSGWIAIVDRVVDHLIPVLSRPWISIWMSPRETMRRIVNRDPSHHVTMIAAFAGALSFLDLSLSASLGVGPSLMPPVMVLYLPEWTFFSAFIGAGFGVAVVYVSGFLFRWAGYFLGGVADSREARAAAAWASVPQIWFAVVILGLLLVTGVAQALSPSLPPADAADVIAAAKGFTVERGAAAIIGVWSFVVFLHCLAEVHRFSTWRALGSFLLVVASLALVGLSLALTVNMAIA
jgi:Yip1 domain